MHSMINVQMKDFYGSDSLELHETDTRSRYEALNSVRERCVALDFMNFWIRQETLNAIVSVESITKTFEPDGISIDGVRLWYT